MLPALSAPAVDLKAIERATGFAPRFGPVAAEGISEFLQSGHKTEAMGRFDFGLQHRIDMFLSMNFPVYLVIAIVLLLIDPAFVPRYTLIFWGALAILYLFIDILPGRSGWAQALFGAGLWAVSWAALDWIRSGSPLLHWGWLIAVFAIFLAAGLDLSGTASPRNSDAERLLLRLRRKSPHNRNLGALLFDRTACVGCGNCYEICPVGVFDPVGDDGKAALPRRESCFACGACVKQCPVSALSLGRI